MTKNDMEQLYNKYSFTGSITFVLHETGKISDTTEITVKISEIFGSEFYYSQQKFIGSAELTTEIKPNNELTKNYGTFFEKDGYSFTIYDISPMMLTASFAYPKEYDIWNENTMSNIVYNYDGSIQQGTPKYSIIAMVYDENGNRLERILDSPVDVTDDELAETFAPPSTDKIIVKFCNKQEADENGLPVVLNEMTIDLENLTVVE